MMIHAQNGNKRHNMDTAVGNICQPNSEQKHVAFLSTKVLIGNMQTEYLIFVVTMSTHTFAKWCSVEMKAIWSLSCLNGESPTF